MAALENHEIVENKAVEERIEPSLEEPLPVQDHEESNSELTGSNNLNRTEADLHVIQSKRVELESIQHDLDDLVGRLNTFIADSQEECVIDDLALDFLQLDEEEEAPHVTEKEDGPPEKETRLATRAPEESLVDNVYTTDGSNPPEINWNAIGPILQKHVSDLQKLHNLNQMTNAVVNRIRNITQINDAILQTASKKEEDT